jgi:ribosome-associated toxin RatA of RatAB toxin-antitoxin module
MKRRKLLLTAGALGLPLLLPASAADAAADMRGRIDIDIRRSRGDDYQVFEARAAVLAGAPLQRVWQVLTGYDRLADFIPNMVSSRLVSRQGNECVVAQEGYGRFLFIRQPIRLVLRVQEQPFSSIVLTLLEGNMHAYRAAWQLTSVEKNLTQIIYTGTIAPEFYVPPLFGTSLMKSDLRDMIGAVVGEIEKPPQER